MNVTNRSERIAFLVATGLGLLTAVADIAAPFGDDSSKLTLLLWLFFSGSLGFAMPRSPWRWALLVGCWVSLGHLVVHVLGFPDSIHPNTYATIVILIPVSLAVCSVAAYGGAAARHLTASV